MRSVLRGKTANCFLLLFAVALMLVEMGSSVPVWGATYEYADGHVIGGASHGIFHQWGNEYIYSGDNITVTAAA